jgi:AraC family transcriptional regulator
LQIPENVKQGLSMPASTNNRARKTLEQDGGVEPCVHTYARALRTAGGDQVESLLRDGAGHGVGAALYKAPPFRLSVPALRVSRLSVNLTSTRVGGGVEGERMRSFDSSRYALFLTPAGAPMMFCKEVPSRHINIYFRPGAIGDGDDAALSLVLSQPLLNLVVPGVRFLVDQLLEEIQSPAMLQADAADSLARLLLVRVARYLRRAPAASKTLHPALLARLRDYVMEHLGERILVADLARQAGLSVDRFAVAFKEETGRAPHQFVLAMRLERATDFLRRSSPSVAEVAHTCGFASQQHLTNVMSSRLGVTPRRFRESTHLAAKVEPSDVARRQDPSA